MIAFRLGWADACAREGLEGPAQAYGSGSLDGVVTVVICENWVGRQDGRNRALLFLFGAALLSLGGAFCLHQVWRLIKQT